MGAGATDTTRGRKIYELQTWLRVEIMRIVTWNCSSAFAKKAKLMCETGGDLIIVPECSKNDADALAGEGYTAIWYGSNANKGIAILASSRWTISEVEPPTNEWIVPIQVAGPITFLLVGVWTCDPQKRGYAGYVDELYQAITCRPEWFNKGPVIVAGDFNSNANFDKNISTTNHSSLVALLCRYGLSSAYHHFSNEPHGCEKTPSFHMHWNTRKPHHLDYIFVPNEWLGQLASVAIGSPDVWLKHSDHCPVLADFTEPMPEPRADLSNPSWLCGHGSARRFVTSRTES